MDPQNSPVTQPTAPSITPTNQKSDNYYPVIEIERNTTPNRLYAIPLFGFLVKIIILIPVFLELWLLFIAIEILIFFVNPFIVLFTGKYWKTAFDLAVGALKLGVKIGFFINGVTDKYPGFNLEAPFTWNMAYPEKSSRFFAVPLIGLLTRFILMIPFAVFSGIIGYASGIAVFVSFAPVLFKGYYPETTHELAIDRVRLSHALMAYVFGLSDKYPSYKISWNHKTLKIILVVIAALILLANSISGFISSSKTNTDQPNIFTPTIDQEEIPTVEAF